MIVITPKPARVRRGTEFGLRPAAAGFFLSLFPPGTVDLECPRAQRWNFPLVGHVLAGYVGYQQSWLDPVSRDSLSFGAVSILHAVATGNRFGFDIMEATGLTSGTVYPTLDRLEQRGFLKSKWEPETDAHREGRPARRYFNLTAIGRDRPRGGPPEVPNAAARHHRPGIARPERVVMTPGGRPLALRLALLWIAIWEPLAPRSCRVTWRDQWRADLWHYWTWLSRQPLSRLVPRRGSSPARPRRCLMHSSFASEPGAFIC